MAARSIWKAVLNIGPATVPVKLYSAVQDRAVHFNILEAKTASRVKQHLVNPETGKEVPKEQVRKGYEIERGRFVLLEDPELQAIEPESSRDIEVTAFLPPERISHQWYERPYYLGPDGDHQAYFALTQALQSRSREGFARWVMRKKRYTGARGPGVHRGSIVRHVQGNAQCNGSPRTVVLPAHGDRRLCRRGDEAVAQGAIAGTLLHAHGVESSGRFTLPRPLSIMR